MNALGVRHRFWISSALSPVMPRVHMSIFRNTSRSVRESDLDAREEKEGKVMLKGWRGWVLRRWVRRGRYVWGVRLAVGIRIRGLDCGGGLGLALRGDVVVGWVGRGEGRRDGEVRTDLI